MKTLIVFLLLSFTTSLFAQTPTQVNFYYNYLNKSKQLYSQANYLQSISYILKALETDINYGGDAFVGLPLFLEKIPVENNQQYFEKLSKYISLLASHGYDKKSVKTIINQVNTHGLNFIADSLKPNFYIYSNQLDYNQLIDSQITKQNYKAWRKKLNKNLNPSLVRTLKKIDRIDQHGRSRATKQELMEKDSLVFEMLNTLIHKNNGFPSISEIGEGGYEVISTCIIHMALENIIKLLPSLEAAIKNGNAFIGNDIIYSIDRIAIEEGKFLIYENGQYDIKYDTTRFYKNYSYSSMGAFYIRLKSDSSSHRYLYPLHPDIKQDQVDSIRLKFYVPSIQESFILWEMKHIESEEFKINNYKKPIYINTYL